ncbi:PHD finger protein 20-like protein 1 isoform X3 [Ixodes scapularis]|uniref:PHD finger protein 20-like protein 1 isoform X3 n=1 Tax=Ixodes scapularis TaxID=6945 RepID=UPI001C38C5B2|nr:PHD finger protein 20-like protein 1 isoform X3 [Ixodes scapularis]
MSADAKNVVGADDDESMESVERNLVVDHEFATESSAETVVENPLETQPETSWNQLYYGDDTVDGTPLDDCTPTRKRGGGVDGSRSADDTAAAGDRSASEDHGSTSDASKRGGANAPAENSQHGDEDSAGARRWCSETSNDKSDADSSGTGSTSRRRRSRLAPVYAPGTRVEARDFQQLQWYPAKVVTLDEGEEEVLVHFEGWSSRYDEWLPLDSPRLRPATHPHTRKEQLKKQAPRKPEYKKGEEVLARWGDRKTYPAKVLEVNEEGTYCVLFFDGIVKTLKAINVEKMPQEQKGSVVFPKVTRRDSESRRNRDGGSQGKSRRSSQESRKPASQHETRKGAASPSTPDPRRPHPERAHKQRAEGRKADRRDASTSPAPSSSSSSSQSRKRILLIGGKFMAKKARQTDARGGSGRSTDKKAKRRASSSTEESPAKRERKTSATFKDGAEGSSPAPSVPASAASPQDAPLSYGLELSTSPQFTPDGRRIARKEFIIEEDHNHFKCTHEGCGKSFRKEPLLQSHLKHYHGRSPPSRPSETETPPAAAAPSAPVIPTAIPPAVRPFDLGEPPRVPFVKLEPPSENPLLQAALQVARGARENAPEGSSVAGHCSLGGLSEAVPAVVPATAPATVPATMPAAAPAPAPAATPAPAPAPAAVEEKHPEAPAPALLAIGGPEQPQGQLSPQPPSTGALLGVPGASGPGPTPGVPTDVGGAAAVGGAAPPKPRRMRFVPHFKTLVEGREKRKIAKTEKALIADMEAAAHKRGAGASDRKRKRTSSTRSDKSDEGGSRRPKDEARRARVSETDAGLGQSMDGLDGFPAPSKSKKKRHSITTPFDPSLSPFFDAARDAFGQGSDGLTASEGDVSVEVKSDEVVQCACNCVEESGLMIQCEACLTWQHGSCFGIEEEKSVPDRYICHLCLGPRGEGGVRDSFRYKHDQDWFVRGKMASFGFLRERPAGLPDPEPIRATHDLMCSMHNVHAVLRSVTHKLNVAGSEDHPDLRHFAKPWASALDFPPPRGPGEGPARPGLAGSAYDHAYFAAEREPPDDLARGAPDVIVSAGVDGGAGDLLMQDLSLGALDVGCIEEVVNRGEELPSLDAGEGQSGAAQEAGDARTGSAGKGEEEEDREACRRNLLGHIFGMQDQLEHRLSCMEEQLQILEQDSSINAPDPTITEEEDMLRLKLSLKGLMKDLNAVHKLALFR